MTEYARAFEVFPVVFATESTVENRFGPIKPGPIIITVECWATGNTMQRRAPAPNAQSPARPNDGGGGGGGGGGGSLPQSSFEIEILDQLGTSRAKGTAPLTLEIPPPHGPVFALADMIAGDTWKVRVTYRGGPAYGFLYADYSGNRPVERKSIDLDAVNQLLARILRESRPVTIAFENREDTIQGLKVEQTWFVAFTDPRLSWQFGKPEFPLKVKVFENSGRPFTSLPITAKLIVNDDRLALKAHIEFPYGATLNVKNIIEASVGGVTLFSGVPLFGDLFDALLSELKRFVAGEIAGLDTATVTTLAADIVFTMRDMSLPSPDTPGNACDILVLPQIRLDGVPETVTDLLCGAVTAAFAGAFEFNGLLAQSPGAQAAVQKIAHEVWSALCHFLLGADPGSVLAAHVPSLELSYPGDAPVAMMVTEQSAAPPPPLPPMGALANVDHIVVLMMENRSFDQMLGYLSLPAALGGRARTDVDGLKGTEWNYDRAFNRVGVFPFIGTLFGFEPPHSFADVKEQRGGQTFSLPATGGSGSGVHLHDPGETDPKQITIPPMGGFVLAHTRKLAEKYTPQELADGGRGYGANPGDVMGYHLPANVKLYDFFAEQFTICDRWFAAHPGNTWPNRFITLSGTLAPRPDGTPEIGIPPLDQFVPVHTKTIFDYLTEAGVTWRYYEHDICMLRLFAKYTLGHPNIVDIEDEVAGLEAAAASGTFPAVTFIDPNISDIPPGNDDAPPSDIADGQVLVKRVYDALQKNGLWSKTLLVIVYDEHGGFYDHVESSAVHDPASPDYVAPMFWDPDVPSGPDHIVNFRGVRVPAFVISPLVDPQTVSHMTFDHTSILKTIAMRFLRAAPPPLGERYARANDLGALLTRSSPRPSVPSPSLPASNRLPTGLSHLPGDFHALIGNFR